jgi:hypothetical protein
MKVAIDVVLPSCVLVVVDIVPGMLVLVAVSFRVNVSEVTVKLSISSLNLTEIEGDATVTPVASVVGFVLDTVGGVVSA